MELMTKNSKKHSAETKLVEGLPKGYTSVLETLVQRIKAAQIRLKKIFKMCLSGC